MEKSHIAETIRLDLDKYFEFYDEGNAAERPQCLSRIEIKNPDLEILLRSSSSNREISYVVRTFARKYKTKDDIKEALDLLCIKYDRFLEKLEKDKVRNQFKFFGLITINK